MRPFGVVQQIRIPCAKRELRCDISPESPDVVIVNVIEQEEPGRDVEESKAHDNEAHDSPAPKSNDKSAVQARNGTVCRPGTCMRRRFHAQETAQAAKETAREERDRHKRVLDAEQSQHEEHQE